MIPTPPRVVRVLTVDDQAVFRAAVRDVIQATPGFQVLGEAASGAEALTMTESLRPDLILMDVRMPEMDGIETTRRLRDRGYASVVVLISFEDPGDVDAVARGCGAVATLRKQDFCQGALQRLWAGLT